MAFHVPKQSVLGFFLFFGCHINQDVKPGKVWIIGDHSVSHLRVELGQFVNSLQKLLYKVDLFLAEGDIRYMALGMGIHVFPCAAGLEIVYILGQVS
jgi:hypothetical protein